MRLRRRWIIGTLATVGFLGLSRVAPSVSARTGVLTTNDGTALFGDIVDTVGAGKVEVSSTGERLAIDRKNVKTIQYFDTARQEFDYRLHALAPANLPGHLTLAHWAFDKKEFDAAAEALRVVTAGDPTNADAAALQKRVDAMRPPSSQPGTPPATLPATPPPNPNAPPARTSAEPKTAKRMVTPEEINVVRLNEWRQGDRVTVRVPPEVRQAFVASGTLSPAQLRGLNPNDLAMAILQQGTPAMQKQVHVASDPAPLLEFRQKVNKVVVATCATAACHGTPGKGGQFYLFAGENEPAVYSNFIILNQFTKTAAGVEHPMLDRTRPTDSLLSQFVLPRELADVPHPDVPAFKGMVRNKTEPRYLELVAWMGRSLTPVPPVYEIDLSQAAPETRPAPAGAGPRPGATPRPAAGGTAPGAAPQ